jgi:hypothetical protein
MFSHDGAFSRAGFGGKQKDPDRNVGVHMMVTKSLLEGKR